MNGKSLRVFEVDGQRMTFDTVSFIHQLFYTFKCKKLQAVYLVARKEEFDLYDRLAYSELLSYIDTTLADLVDAPPKEGHSTYDDYTDALRRLREIVHGEIVDEEIFDVEEYALASSD